MEILNAKKEYDLDLEYKDSNGSTALLAAIHEGFSGGWLQQENYVNVLNSDHLFVEVKVYCDC